MSNRYWERNRISDRVTLEDIIKTRKAKIQRIKMKLDEKERKELEEYLARKQLILLDKDPDAYKEER